MKIVGMIPVFNEADIISESITHLLNQGIEPVVLDNGSSDGTYEICNKFHKNGQIKLFQYSSNKFNLILTLRKLYDKAIQQSPDWVLLSSADEFPESGIPNVTLRDAISQVNSEGYNLIKFNCFDFFITDNDNRSATTITKKLPYYSFKHDNCYRAWKFFCGIDVFNSHFPIFPSDQHYKIYPKKFVIRHYPFRDKDQAIKRLELRRKRNESTSETKIGFHAHYWYIQSHDCSRELDHNLLSKNHEDNEWNLEKKFSFSPNEKIGKAEIFSEDGFLKYRPEISNLMFNIRQKQNTIKNLRKKLEMQNNTITRLEKTIQAIQNSFTWRSLTKIDKFRKSFSSSNHNKS